MNFNIEVFPGASVRLPTGGKYCDRDIVVDARDAGGITQYIKFKAKPNSTSIFSIINPLGGFAKKVSIQSPKGSETETALGVIQRYTIDATTGIGGMKLLNASTGNITLYGVRQTESASSNSQFAVQEGKITARSYNATSAIWDIGCEYDIEIWQ